MSQKSRGVYAVITDFSLQLQRSEKTGTELGKPWTVSAPVPALLDRRGRAHTKWRDRPVPVRWRSAPCLPPSQRSWAAAARERPRCGACHGASRSLRRLARRCAPRRGRLGDQDAAMAYTCARSTRLENVQALPRKAHAAILLAPGPGGPAGVWRAYAILAGEGCAGRFASGRGVGRSLALPPEPPRAQGARYALGEGAERGGRTEAAGRR